MMIKKTVEAVLLAAVLIILSAAVVFASSPEYEQKKKELAEKRIGVQTATTLEKKAREDFPNAEILCYNTSPEMLLALKTGKIDAYLENDMIVQFMQAEIDIPLKMTNVGDASEAYAPFFPKNEKGERLQKQYSEFIEKLEADGTLEAIQNKWFTGTDDEKVLSVPTAGITGGETLIAAIEPSYPPFDYIKDNEITGFEVDVFNLFCTEYGYVPEYRIVQFAGILSGVSSGMFDVGAATLTITEERKNAGYFGKPFFMTPVSLIERDETKENKITGFFDSLKEKFVGTFITEDRWKMFLAGTLVTFRIMLFSLIGGTVLGFLVFCVTRNGGRISGRITEFCKWLIRGFPEVVFLMILYYIVFAGAETSGETVAVIGFGLIFACSMHSMLVMGEATVDIGQKEAAYSLGYGNFMTFLRFILPQSAMHFMPSYISEVVSLIKATAVVGYIAIVDVTRVGDLIRGRTYEAFVPLIAVSVVYFVMAFLMKLVLKAFVRKIDTRRRSDEAVLKGLEIK